MDRAATRATLYPGVSQMNAEEVFSFTHHAKTPAALLETIPRIYNCYFSTADYLRSSSRGGALSALSVVAGSRSEPELRHIVLFRKSGAVLTVANELPTLTPAAASAISREIFREYADVREIHFERTPLPAASMPRPSLDLGVIENDVVVLPDSFSAYLDGIGKATRKHLLYYERRLKREFPSAQFRLVEKGDCGIADIRAIAQFQRARLGSKGIRIAAELDPDHVARMHASCVKWGHVGLYEVDGAVAAGVIFYRFGRDFYFLVIAHDEAFSKFNIGQLCLLNTIGTAIEAQGRMVHMGWGANDYKKRFCARSFPCYRVAAYRNHPATLLSRVAWRVAAKRISCALGLDRARARPALADSSTIASQAPIKDHPDEQY
jgi:hypothetical protein